MRISGPNILEDGVLDLLVPELKGYWHPTRVEDFHYIRPELRKHYLKALERRAGYYERQIDDEPLMRKDWFAIVSLIDLLTSHTPEIGRPADRMVFYLADEFVQPMPFEKDELVVAFDNLAESPDGRTHLGSLYLAKVVMEKIDLEMMLVGPTKNDLPAGERGRLPTIQGTHALNYSWAMHYETFTYYYANRSAIGDHLRLLEESDVGITKNTSGVMALAALRSYFEHTSLKYK